MIRYRPFTWLAGAAAAPVTSFSDDFQRADTTLGLGAQWFGESRTPLQSSALAVPTVRISSGEMVALLNGVGAGSQVPGSRFYPVPLLNPAVYGQAQFAEVVYQSSAGGGNVDLGPGCLMTGDFVTNTQNGYWLLPNIAGTLDLRRYDTMQSVLASAAYVLGAGDVIRLEVTPAAAGANVCRALVNGAELFNFTDAGGPVFTGYPGLWHPAAVLGNTRNFSRFTGGIL